MSLFPSLKDLMVCLMFFVSIGHAGMISTPFGEIPDSFRVRGVSTARPEIAEIRLHQQAGGGIGWIISSSIKPDLPNRIGFFSCDFLSDLYSKCRGTLQVGRKLAGQEFVPCLLVTMFIHQMYKLNLQEIIQNDVVINEAIAFPQKMGSDRVPYIPTETLEAERQLEINTVDTVIRRGRKYAGKTTGLSEGLILKGTLDKDTVKIDTHDVPAGDDRQVRITFEIGRLSTGSFIIDFNALSDEEKSRRELSMKACNQELMLEGRGSNVISGVQIMVPVIWPGWSASTHRITRRACK